MSREIVEILRLELQAYGNVLVEREDERYINRIIYEAKAPPGMGVATREQRSGTLLEFAPFDDIPPELRGF